MKTELLEQLSLCSSCGLCQGICPVFRQKKMEQYGPRGFVNLARRFVARKIQAREIASYFAECTLCGQCARICPAAIELDKIFFRMRVLLHGAIPIAYQQRLLTRALASNQKRLDFLQVPFAQLLRLGSDRGALAVQPFRPENRDGNWNEKVLFFAGCLIRRTMPHIGELSLQILDKLGYQSVIMPELGCCGRPQAVQGYKPEKLYRKNLELLASQDCKWFVTACPGCLSMYRDILPSILTGEAGQLAEELASKWLDIHELVDTITSSPPGNAQVWWHKPCLMTDQVNRKAMNLLHQAGCSISWNSGNCCGVALELLKCTTPGIPSKGQVDPWKMEKQNLPVDKILPKEIWQEASQINAEAIITACPGCILQLRRSSSPFIKIPVYYDLEVWAGLLTGNALPWRSSSSRAFR